jgi:uncharacterized protein YxjI
MALRIDPNDYDRFVLRQRFRIVVNEYVFSLPGPDGISPGEPFLWVKQKALSLKEDIRFFADEALIIPYMRIQALQRFDPRARYNVTLADGTLIGQIQKVFRASLLRSTYRLYDPLGTEVSTVTEERLVVALFRRVVGFIPYVENVANWLPIPYHFTFLRGDQILGTYRRQLYKFRDTYTLDLTADTDRTLDRRLILAMAVGMDALQAR